MRVVARHRFRFAYCVLVPSSDPDAGLFIRRDAAIRLVAAGEITGWDALLLVVAPPPALATVTKRRRAFPEEVKAEARRLHAAGRTGPEVAESMGLSYATV